ncbi:hypothetical protein PRVXH_001839 [Proteinivorax hydrogeniformans]|uniref:Uncharacterized protein n=1 Tax=Proteinivorax hydrogeniformans TaxID=1826727 RepID=A0AAU8HQU8_9FIRM
MISEKVAKVIKQLEDTYIQYYSSYKVEDFDDKKEVVITKKKELKKLERILRYLYTENLLEVIKHSAEVEAKIDELKVQGKNRAKDILLKRKRI